MISGKRDSAVITGAGRGIGRAVAIQLAERGLDVVLLARGRAELEATRGAIESLGRRALVLACDVSHRVDVERAASQALATFGTPQILVNNAGGILRARVADMTEDEWDAVVDVNLKGVFLVTRAFLPSMLRERRGRLVAVSSISATLGTARQSAYAAAKWGALGFTKSLAEELRGTGLQTMAVMPGAVATSMLDGSGFMPQMTAEDVARTVVFAALDAPDAMNGSAIEIFGP
jgi:3-oxoacyl-[acyl-carrier protein] reductase